MSKGNRISKAITRTGDAGQTSLVGGARVSKASLRVEAYGDVDELNSLLGLARARLTDAQTDDVLSFIQNDLFTLGADLASPADIEVPRIGDSFVKTLEGFSEEFLVELEPQKDEIEARG